MAHARFASCRRAQLRMDFMVHTDRSCDYDDEIRALGSKIIPCLHPGRPWRYARNFRQVLKEHGPYDVIHSHVHHYSGVVLQLARLARVPTRIAHSHCDTVALDSRSNLIRRLYLAIMRRSIQRNASSGWPAASREAAMSLFGPNWRSNPGRRILYCSVDLTPFGTEGTDKRAVRRSLGLSEDAFVIGHVGRFRAPKNHGFMFEVFSEIVEREPRARLLLVGEGEPVNRANEPSLRWGFLVASGSWDYDPMCLESCWAPWTDSSFRHSTRVSVSTYRGPSRRTSRRDRGQHSGGGRRCTTALAACLPSRPASAWAEAVISHCRKDRSRGPSGDHSRRKLLLQYHTRHQTLMDLYVAEKARR